MKQELIENARIVESFLVTNITKGVTNTGAPYLSIILQDVQGQIEARKWDATEDDLRLYSPGNLVEVTADVVKYRTVFQLKVVSAKLLNPNDIDIRLFVPSAPVSVAELEERLGTYLKEIHHPEMALLVTTLVKEDMERLRVYPAASKNHHEIASGLLFHIVSMLDLAKSLCQLYPTLDKDLLYSGIILHDLGKTEELSGPVIPKYTLKGRLIGHISIMQGRLTALAQQLAINSETPILLSHLILSHHGRPEYGSPQTPLLREAEVLHMIDNMDARIYMMNKALEPINEGEFTPRIGSLEDRMFYKPFKTKG